MALPQVGCHQIVFGKTDPESMYDAIARAGYAGVESGLTPDPAATRAALERRGLAYVASHTFIDRLWDTLVTQIDFLQAMGGSFLCVSGRDYRTGGEYRETGALLQRAGVRCRAEGIRLLYHHHDWEIVHDMFGLQNLLAATDPGDVGLCLDTHWSARGGQDPVAVLREYRERTPYVHLKDYGGGTQGVTWTELGQGVLNWAAILQEIGSWSIPWVMVEQDSTTLRPETSVRISRDALRAHGW